MVKILKVKFDYENEVEEIVVTRVEQKGGQLIAYNGDDKVGEFIKSKIERWSITEK